LGYLSDAKRRITVEHLLMMSPGLNCGYAPGETEVLDMLKSKDFVASTLGLPIAAEPGSEFAYCSGGMHLLSAIVSRSTGMRTIDFAQHNLFGPIGITETAWPADPQGINHGWADLRMHPRDMARRQTLRR
jgi:CubicO group peptidase (beta-lactamase class C family)